MHIILCKDAHFFVHFDYNLQFLWRNRYQKGDLKMIGGKDINMWMWSSDTSQRSISKTKWLAISRKSSFTLGRISSTRIFFLYFGHQTRGFPSAPLTMGLALSGLSIQLSFCSKELERIIVVNSLGFPAYGGLARRPFYPPFFWRNGGFDPIFKFIYLAPSRFSWLWPLVALYIALFAFKRTI